jgi:iron(III) transport system substrate-binding protein
MKKLYLALILVLVLTLLITGCSTQKADLNQTTQGVVQETGKIVVYSGRTERFVEALLEKFTADTGIEVIVLHGANPLQIVEEKNNVQADIFISNDMGALGYLHNQGLLQGSEPEGIEVISELFRSDDNAYFAISARSRGFIYNKDLISEEDMPKSLEDLYDEKWASVPNGYAITRGGNSGMIGNISALRYEWGDEKTSAWIKAIKEHAAGIYEGHGNIRRAVGSGEHAFGLVNNYYFHQQLIEPENNNVGFIYVDQEENQMGVIVNAAGLGMIKGGPNRNSADRFMAWILLPENQAVFVGESLELLINDYDGVEYPEAIMPYIVDFKDLKIQSMPIMKLGDYFEDTRALIEAAGLDLELR